MTQESAIMQPTDLAALAALREAVRDAELRERAAWRALQAAKDAHAAARKACIVTDKALIRAETIAAIAANGDHNATD